MCSYGVRMRMTGGCMYAACMDGRQVVMVLAYIRDWLMYDTVAAIAARDSVWRLNGLCECVSVYVADSHRQEEHWVRSDILIGANVVGFNRNIE